MATDLGGPATGQALTLYQGASKTVGVTIPDPTGAYSVPGVTADWWAGPSQNRIGGLLAPVAGSAGAIHKTGLAVTVPALGTVQVTFVAEPSDLAGLKVGTLATQQHEIWLTAPGGEPEPVTIGQLTILGTVKGSAGA